MTQTTPCYLKTWTLFLLLLVLTGNKLNAQSPVTYTWIGATSTDWNDSTNWNPKGVPNISSNVMIPIGTTNIPNITSNKGSITVNNLDIEGELDFANNNILKVNGLLSGTGKMHFTFVQIHNYDYRTETDSINLSSANNTIGSLISAAGIGIVISGYLTITKELQLTCGSYQGDGSSIAGSIFNTGNQLTLASTSYVDFAGYMPHFPFYQPTISGIVTIQKLIPKGIKANRDLGAAVAGGPTISQAFNGDTTFSYTNTTWSSPLDTTTPLQPLIGYRTLVDASSGDVTLSYSGTLLTGDQSPVLTAGQDQFSFIANPYQSQVDFNNVISSYSTGLYNGYWYLDPKTFNIGNEHYNYYGTNVGVSNIYANNPLSQYLQPGLGFFVCSNTSGTPTLTFSEDSKNNGSTQANIFGVTTPLNRIATGLFTGGKNIDGAVVVFNSNFSNAIGQEDGLKISYNGENITFAVAGKDLCANGWSLPTATDELPLHLYNLNTNTAYILRLDASQFEGNGLYAFIQDNVLGTQKLLTGDSNIVAFTTTTDTTTYSNRYSIVFSSSTLPVKSISLTATAFQENQVSIKWSVVGESRIVNYKVERSEDGTNFNDMATVTPAFLSNYSYVDAKAINGINYYRIKAIDNLGVVAYSKIVSCELSGFSKKLNVYPNPVVNNSFYLDLGSASTGKYIVSLVDKLGRTVYTTTLNHSVALAVENIALNKKLATGSYTVKATDVNGKVSTTQLIIK